MYMLDKLILILILHMLLMVEETLRALAPQDVVQQI